MNGFIAFALVYIALGAMAIVFSHEIASGMNRFSVWFYEMFPAVKKAISLSRLAGSPQNYKSCLYFCRILGVIMIGFGIVFLGLVIFK